MSLFKTTAPIIITCYNHGIYLQSAIDSALGQSWENIEVIVVDDGSTDNTPEVCGWYTNYITYIRVERVGLSAARNIGTQYSKGQFVIFLDADDYLYPGAVEQHLYYFRLYPQAGFISGSHDRVDADSNYMSTVNNKGDGYISLLYGNYLGMESCILYRRDLFFHFHFDTSLKACEDYDLNLRIARVLPTFHHDNRVTAYRIHSGNMSRNHTLMLQSALHVLHQQAPLLQSEAERAAYKQGILNWQEYYSSTTLQMQ